MPQLRKFRVIITPRAGSEVQEIHDFIARDSPDNAADVVGWLMDGIDSLEYFPLRANEITPRQKPPIYRLSLSPYLVFYQVIDADAVVLILSVRHGAMRQPNRFD